jgi:hypothetical protein
LALLRGREDCLDIETVLARFFLADAPDFIDDGVPRHELAAAPYFPAGFNNPRTLSQSASRAGHDESASSVAASPTPCGPCS